MSQKATTSVFGQSLIQLNKSVARSPKPMNPTRMRSFAPSTCAGTAASVPAIPVANLPRKWRRESIIGVYQAHALRRCRDRCPPYPKHRRDPVLIMQFQPAEIEPAGSPGLSDHHVIVILAHFSPVTICVT